MGYLSRLPNSNDLPKYDTNPWIEENDILDATFLLIDGSAKRCQRCRRPIRVRYLDEYCLCPDCQENAEQIAEANGET